MTKATSPFKIESVCCVVLKPDILKRGCELLWKVSEWAVMFEYGAPSTEYEVCTLWGFCKYFCVPQASMFDPMFQCDESVRNRDIIWADL